MRGTAARRVSWYGGTGAPARTAEVKILHKSIRDTPAAQDIHQLILPLAISPLPSKEFGLQLLLS